MTTNSKIKINLDSLKARREWKRHKVKDGHNIFRILPPFGEASNGYAYRKWQIIWGLLDPETGRMRPFASSMTSEKKCPVTEFVATLTAKADKLKSELQAQGVSKEEVTERLKSLNTLISDLKPKTVYIYNAADKAGEVGLLELKSTAHKKIKSEMAQYVHDYNQDPTSLNSDDDDSGLWFDVVRSGLGRDTEYDVKKCQVKQKDEKGRMSFVDDRSALPDSVVENYHNLAYDLASVYQIKSYDDLVEILQANMPTIIQKCPDANLLGDIFEQEVLEDKVEKTVYPTTLSAPKGAGKINIKLDADDGDDDEVVVTKPAAKAPVKAVAVMDDDDDFMALAEKALNS